MRCYFVADFKMSLAIQDSLIYPPTRYLVSAQNAVYTFQHFLVFELLHLILYLVVYLLQ